MSLLGKPSGPKLFVRLSKVSALEHVRLRQVLLYNILLKFSDFESTLLLLGKVYNSVRLNM